ncbi:hypothetical protein [Actinoplanes awajinensis]|uniref:LRV domain-containing protein n=1 Tax=Actinoplanes awajinensis subsp. mycoplanecinus TaxID=135947 RepID=A0A101JA26_9ACTN|nr:hypothetical protein [Actinoplanes awajinensis]KUL22984.1 hypothetical protein ADL15_47090 [Actinoplanes awajinensis subsp. mycoplanecinus]
MLRLHADDWLDARIEEPALCGLAANPAAPDGVLLELLRSWPEAVPAAFRRRTLPAPVVAAMVEHPSVRVRAALAANPLVEPAARLRLAGDPDDEVVRRLLADREFPAPDRLLWIGLDRLLGQFRRGLMTEEDLADEVLEEIGRDRRVIGAARRHPDPAVRRALLGMFRPTYGDPEHEVVQALLKDEDVAVRGAAAEAVRDWTARAARETERADVRGNGYDVRHILSATRLSRALIDELLAEDDKYSLDQIAKNPSVPPEVLDVLVGHPEPEVRAGAARHPHLTAGQLARLAADPADEVRAALAAHPGLTEEQRAGLDLAPADPGCGHYPPDTPGELLLRSFLERPGRSRLPHLPNFPTEGLARFAGDPDPAVRRLAVRDPHAAPELIDHLTADPDEHVRRAAAACPRLPAARLLALLDDPDLAGAAAANPSLPEPHMWALIISKPR